MMKLLLNPIGGVGAATGGVGAVTTGVATVGGFGGAERAGTLIGFEIP